MNGQLAWIEEDVRAELQQLKLNLTRRGQGVIDLSMINPDLPPPRFLMDKLLEAATRRNNHRYAVSRGVRKLREAFAVKYAERFKVSLDPETEICVTMGSKDAICHGLLCMAERGAGVLAGAPSYPAHLSAIRIAGQQLVTFPMSFDEDEMLAAIAERVAAHPGIKVLLLNFPNNPLGSCVSESFYRRLLDIIQGRDIKVLNDFVYGEMGHRAGQPVSLLSIPGFKERAVEVYSLSKAYSVPGWRVGALVGNSRIVRALAALKSHIDYGLFLPIQHAAAAALCSAENLAAEAAAVYGRRAAAMTEGLRRQGWEVRPPQAGASVWARLPERLPDDGDSYTRRALLEAQVLATPGRLFGAAFARHVRFAMVASEETIREVLGRMALLSAAFAVFLLTASGSAFAVDKCDDAARLVNEGVRLSDGSPAETDLYRRAIESCPRMAKAHYNLGLSLSKQKKYDEAVSAFQRAIEIRDEALFRVAIATVRLEENNAATAEQQLEKALELEPKSVPALLGLSLVYEKQDKLDRATEVLYRAKTIDPSNARVHFNLAVLLERQNNLDQALGEYKRAAELDLKNFEAWLQLGLAYFRKGQLEESRRALSKAEEIEPDSAAAQRALGGVYERLGDRDKAELALRRAVELEPADPDTKVNLAVLLIRAKKQSLANELLKRLVESGLGSAKAYSALGWSELELGQYEQAEKSLKRAIELDALNAPAHNNLGVVYQRLGRKDLAADEFRAAVRIDPNLAAARENIERFGVK